MPRRSAVLAVPLIALSGALCAPEPAPGQTIELAALEASALASSPALAEAAARRDAAVALAGGSGVAADPRLELWARNLVPSGAEIERELEVEIVQPVRFPGKRAAAEAVAAAAVALAESELEAARRSLVGELRRGFARLAAADREQRSLAESHELLELLTATAQTRLGTGQESVLSVLESELMTDAHDLELEKVFAGFLAERARLGALAGVAPDSLPLLVGVRPEPSFPPVQTPLPIDPEAPRLVAARRRLELAERRLDLARLELKPDFSLGGGFAWPEDGDPALLARAGIELPFFRKRRSGPIVLAAEAGVAEARAALRRVELDLAADAARWSAERDRLERTLAKIAGSVIPRTSAALDAARIAFLEGRLPFSRLFELQNDWFAARVDLARIEAERFALWAEWQEVAIVEPGGSSTSPVPAGAVPGSTAPAGAGSRPEVQP